MRLNRFMVLGLLLSALLPPVSHANYAAVERELARNVSFSTAPTELSPSACSQLRTLLDRIASLNRLDACDVHLTAFGTLPTQIHYLATRTQTEMELLLRPLEIPIGLFNPTFSNPLVTAHFPQVFAQVVAIHSCLGASAALPATIERIDIPARYATFLSQSGAGQIHAAADTLRHTMLELRTALLRPYSQSHDRTLAQRPRPLEVTGTGRLIHRLSHAPVEDGVPPSTLAAPNSPHANATEYCYEYLFNMAPTVMYSLYPETSRATRRTTERSALPELALGRPTAASVESIQRTTGPGAIDITASSAVGMRFILSFIPGGASRAVLWLAR